MKRNVAILIFDEVEVLDFTGPFEVFAVANELNGGDIFHTYIVAEHAGSIRARNGLKVLADFTLESAPAPQILIVPGGAGTRPLLKKASVLEWIRQRARKTEVVASVCTGALVLAQAGLLSGQPATTHYLSFDLLRELEPTAAVQENRRFIDNGRIVTSAGIAAGIDMSLHLVARLHGEAIARQTAQYMEYHWTNDGGLAR